MEMMSFFSLMFLRMKFLKNGDIYIKKVFMKRYEVYWVDLNPTKGSEINKTRPCVIISPDELNKHLKTVVVAPLTSQVRDYYPFRLKVKMGGKEGQIAIDQIRVVDKSRLQGLLDELTEDDAEKLRELLNEMFCVK